MGSYSFAHPKWIASPDDSPIEASAIRSLDPVSLGCVPARCSGERIGWLELVRPVMLELQES
jgi:hypothetical protein